MTKKLYTSLVSEQKLNRLHDLEAQLTIRIIHTLWDDEQDQYVVLWESSDQRMQTWVELL